MKKKRIALYPFTDQYYLLGNPLPNNYCIECLIVENDWIDRVKNRCLTEKSLNILSPTTVALGFFDQLIVLNNCNSIAPCSPYQDSFVRLCATQGIEIHYEMNNQRVNYLSSSLHNLKSTILLNLSAVDGNYHTQTEFSIWNHFKRENANMYIISPTALAPLYDYERFPIEHFCNLSMNEAIISFNQYIYDIETKHSPDVIMISSPQPVNPIEFGGQYKSMLNRALINAINPDFVTLYMYGRNQLDIYFRDILASVEKDIGIDIDCVTLSEYIFDEDEKNPGTFLFYEGRSDEQEKMYEKLCELKIKTPIFLSSRFEDFYSYLVSKITKTSGGKAIYEQYI